MTTIGRELAATVACSGIIRTSVHAVDGARIIVDTRGLGNRPHVESLVAAVLGANAVDLGVSLVAGVANSGTVWAALAARSIGLPHCNVLVDGPREKGLGRQIEPDEIAGHRVALVDNWVSSGTSLLTAKAIVEAAGATVVAALAISAATEIEQVKDLEVRVLWPRDVLLRFPTIPVLRINPILTSTSISEPPNAVLPKH